MMCGRWWELGKVGRQATRVYLVFGPFASLPLCSDCLELKNFVPSCGPWHDVLPLQWLISVRLSNFWTTGIVSQMKYFVILSSYVRDVSTAAEIWLTERKTFIILRKFPSISSLLSFFFLSWKCIKFCPMPFLCQLKWSCSFLPSFC